MAKNKDAVITRMLHTVADLHVREAAEGEAPSRTITGYAILFNTPSAPLYAYDDEEAREVIAPEAVTKELLDGCDIKMTMFHDRQLILARSKNGAGTLTYSVDDKGVAFEFDAPNTADGDKALELVRRGDISGCSFMFSTHYYDSAYVERSVERVDGKTQITYTVRTITGIYDFTLAADPAYPDTNCEAEARELIKELRKPEVKKDNSMREQVREMRRAASYKL
ncbi:MAG: HK97 family phage prohead protease [Bacteroidales bacterium]|jgi:HK97 family phage prohead protease|nr:HK97 family phage prohead protease [Bacteroidales bacterium]